MNNKQITCDPSRIELFLSQQLDDLEQAAFELHLDDCRDCRQRLEKAAASEEIWSGVRNSLQNQKLPTDYLHSEDPAIDSTTDGDVSFNLDAVINLLSPTDDDRMIGRLGSYEVLGVIGSGGMGVVLKAFDAALNRYVAIKILSPHLGSSGAARKRFSREAQAAAAVVHDNVIEIYGVSDVNGLPYLVMPYVRDPSLQRRLDKDGPLAIVEILRVGMQTAAGLAAAHSQGLVHRDVKPANILLADGVERVKLADFGLARAADDASLTMTGIIAGTPQYMSPEQARGDSVDQRSDLFSLGSVLYAMATGRMPFRAETSYGVLRRITDQEPKPIREINPDIPEWLCDIIKKLMSKQPGDRFESASKVAELLEECLAHVQQPTVVPLPTSLVPQAKSDRFFSSLNRRSGIVTTIALFGFSLLGMILWQATAPPDIAGKWIAEERGEVVLEQKHSGRYEGTYSKTSTDKPGTIQIKWSRIERRFNGTWREGDLRFGKISLRLVDDKIRGAWTTSKKSSINPATPKLADLLWVRSNKSTAKPLEPLASNGVTHTVIAVKSDKTLPVTEDEKAITRLVLVFSEDLSRRAIPAVLVDAGSHSLVVAASPAGLVPDGTSPAVDRFFLEISSQPSVKVVPHSSSMREFSVFRIYRTEKKLTNYYPKNPVKLKAGDYLSAILPGSSVNLLVKPRAAQIVAFNKTATLNLPERNITHQFEKLMEINSSLPEGTPLFKNGKLAGLTLLGTRFLGAKVKKSYVIPVEKIITVCNELRAKTAKTSLRNKREYRCPMHPQIHQKKTGRCAICGMELAIVDPLIGEWQMKEVMLTDPLKPILKNNTTITFNGKMMTWKDKPTADATQGFYSYILYPDHTIRLQYRGVAPIEKVELAGRYKLIDRNILWLGLTSPSHRSDIKPPLSAMMPDKPEDNVAYFRFVRVTKTQNDPASKDESIQHQKKSPVTDDSSKKLTPIKLAQVTLSKNGIVLEGKLEPGTEVVLQIAKSAHSKKMEWTSRLKAGGSVTVSVTRSDKIKLGDNKTGQGLVFATEVNGIRDRTNIAMTEKGAIPYGPILFKSINPTGSTTSGKLLNENSIHFADIILKDGSKVPITILFRKLESNDASSLQYKRTTTPPE